MEHEEYIGKRLLIGITYVQADGTENKDQFFGEISRIDGTGIYIMQSNGEEFSIPPTLESLKRAKPGKYYLKKKDIVVIDPDYVCTWTLQIHDLFVAARLEGDKFTVYGDEKGMPFASREQANECGERILGKEVLWSVFKVERMQAPPE